MQPPDRQFLGTFTFISVDFLLVKQTFKTGVQDFIFSQCGTHIYLKFESYNLQSINLVHKAVDFYVRMLKNSPTSIFNFIFSGAIPPDTC